MTQYAILDPYEKKVALGDFSSDLAEAKVEAGLDGVDFGTVARWPDGRSLNIIADEFGLLKPQEAGYFALTGNLYWGKTILFIADEHGETIDFPSTLLDHFNAGCGSLVWINTPREAERAIRLGQIARPEMRVNGELIWAWKAQANDNSRSQPS